VAERFTVSAREVVHAAQDEARALRHTWLGTEHLLLALFRGDSVALRVLASLEVRRENVLAGYRGMMGPCEEPMAFRPDPEALAAVGIDLEQVRRRVEEAFGPGALERTWAWQRSGSLCFTPRSRKVLELALREARALGHGYVGPEHILLGLAHEGMGMAAQILRRFSATYPALRWATLEELRRPA
jgi:ATP-dependent Clp protease ATP-binding subunit ClpA